MAEKYWALLPPSWETKIDEWLKEDIPSMDYGGFVVGDKQERAEILCKANGVLCGVPFVNRIFDSLGCKIEWHFEGKLEFHDVSNPRIEGDFINVEKGNVPVAHVTGPACRLLQGERVSLNLMARSSGIATRARAAKNLADNAGWKGKVAGTRKTTPGFRLVEKYSLIVGGADTHRNDLSSMTMLKDNHIASSGSIIAAVKKARSVVGFSGKIEVECQNQEEAEEACLAGADIVMLDNHKPDRLGPVSEYIKKKYPHVIVEASGGVTLENVSGYFLPHVDVISMGSLIQSVPHIDFSLNIGAKVQQK